MAREENEASKTIGDVLANIQKQREESKRPPPPAGRPNVQPERAPAAAPRPAAGPARPQGAQPNPPRTPPQAPAAPPPPAPARPAAPQAPTQTATGGAGPYRFLNPYNFVRWLEAKEQCSTPATALLGRCTPPPRDRYVGLTGRITCEIEAITPLFVSDSHDIAAEPVGKATAGRPAKEHRTYRFFQYDGKPALPASSLRGMVRSVFEAVTNSCFSVFEGPRLSYRLEAPLAATLVPARIEKSTSGKWTLRLLPGLAPLSPGQRPRALYAATVHLYDPIEGRTSRVPKVNLKGLTHGESCWALVEKKGLFTYVLELDRSRARLPASGGSHQQVVQGWLCINNQNIETKRKERFFFAGPGTPGIPTHVPLLDDQVEKYQDLIKDYQERHADAIQARGSYPPDRILLAKNPRDPDEPAFSRYIYRKEDLQLGEGTLVYVSLSGPLNRLKVEFIAPAAVPRVSYNQTVGKLLPDEMKACREYDGLCPACRTFGWVHGAHEKQTGKQRAGREAEQQTTQLDKDDLVAYAGRVRFSHGALLGEPQAFDKPISLAILGSPKPTTTRFYVQPKEGTPHDGMSDAEAGYDGANVLRGRKVYRHHGTARSLEYERTTDTEHSGRDDQNRSVQDVLKPGNRFRFTIEFENLAPIELGALLWAVEMEGGLVHRLGYAKPLGFGSTRLTVLQLEYLDSVGRYSALDAVGGWRDAAGEKNELVAGFKRAMMARYDSPFEQLPNVRDLSALLSSPPDLPIHYPRTTRTPSAEGKNFEWFVGNKRSGREGGPKLALRLAAEDTRGLPLLDKQGRER